MKARTRAHELGVRPNAYARRAARFADAVRKRAELLAYEWAEIDNTVVGEVDELLRAVDKFVATVNDAVAYLKEPVE